MTEYHSKSAFTLIELLIVIGTLSILATAVVFILNPIQLLAQSRDSSRMNGLRILNNAIELTKAYSSSIDSTVSKTVYVSLPDTVGDKKCTEYALPTLASGWSYACNADAANFRKVDGNGWLPINLSSIPSIKPPLSTLPVDPINNFTDYYAYGYDSDNSKYAIASKLDSTKYLTDVAAKDGGNWDVAFETRPVAWLGSSFNCGVDTVQDIGGNTYNTVSIGSQCFMATNIMTTKYPDGTNITRGPTGATWDASDHGYYAYPPNSTNTAEETLANIIANNLGFVYQWSAAVHGALSCNGTGASQPNCTTPVQGICPDSWHVPSHYEYTLLEKNVGSSPGSFLYDETTIGSFGVNEGTNLKLGGSSGFNGVLTGYRSLSGSFFNWGVYGYFWSSTDNGSSAWYRFLISSTAQSSRSYNNKANGFSVRCLKN